MRCQTTQAMTVSRVTTAAVVIVGRAAFRCRGRFILLAPGAPHSRDGDAARLLLEHPEANCESASLCGMRPQSRVSPAAKPAAAARHASQIHAAAKPAAAARHAWREPKINAKQNLTAAEQRQKTR